MLGMALVICQAGGTIFSDIGRLQNYAGRYS
jgi:hypothetical protein